MLCAKGALENQSLSTSHLVPEGDTTELLPLDIIPLVNFKDQNTETGLAYFVRSAWPLAALGAIIRSARQYLAHG